MFFCCCCFFISENIFSIDNYASIVSLKSRGNRKKYINYRRRKMFCCCCCCCFFISEKYFFNSYRWCFQSSEKTEEIYKLWKNGNVFVVVVFLFWKIFFQRIIIDRVFRVQREPKKYINYGEREMFCCCYCFFISENIFLTDNYASVVSLESREKYMKLWKKGNVFVVVVVFLFRKNIFSIVIDGVFRSSRGNRKKYINYRRREMFLLLLLLLLLFFFYFEKNIFSTVIDGVFRENRRNI